MIITRTPYRLSLFGGSSDYPSFYSRYGSLLVGFTIDKYCYITLRQNHNIFDYKTRVTYSIIESVKNNFEIQNPGVKGTLEFKQVEDGLSIAVQGDLPARTGIGSSSSLVVGLIHALDVYQNGRETLSNKQIAQEAIKVERQILNEPGGVQDQIWAAYGGVNSIQILYDGSFYVRPLPVSIEFLQEFRSRSVLCHTGFSRNSFGIAASHDNKESIGIKRQILNLAEHGLIAFENEDIEEIGTLLHRSWQLKRSISTEITNDHINGIYDKALDNGAIGGKLLGAGGNGFMFFVLKDDDKKGFCDKLGLTAIDYDYSYRGSELLLK